MAVGRSCTLNGVTLWPDQISGGRKRVGTTLTSANGSTTYLHRGLKGEWTLTWDRPKEAAVAAIVTLYETIASMTFVLDGTSYTVTIVPDATFERTHLLAGSVLGTTFNVSLTLREL